MSSQKIIVLAILASVISLAGWWLQEQTTITPAAQSPIKLHVLATFFPLYDFARNVGQDKIELNMLFTQTPEVASFTPADIKKINQADIVIKNGVGLEPVLDDLIKSSDNKNLTVVDTSEEIAILEDEEEVAGNPHIWLDTTNAIIQVVHIRDALAAADPSNAAFYKQQAEAYIAQLRQLDQEIASRLTPLPHKDFVAFHSAFVYFAKRYGLRQAAAIEEFPGKEPTPQYLAEIIEIIKESGLKTIFAEPQFSPKVVEAIARDLGLQVRVLNPVETGDPARDSYYAMMQTNTQTLVEALQ